MSLQWRASGANTTIASSGATSISLPYPTGMALGDILIVFIGAKPLTANSCSITAPAGWTLLASTFGGGYGATLGADTGNTQISVLVKEYTGAESTNDLPAFGLTNVDACWGQMVRADDNANANITYGISSVVTADQTVGGSVSATLSADPGLTNGDFVMVGMCIPTDVNSISTFSAPTLTATGITASLTQVSGKSSATGNDIAGATWIGNVSAGTSSAAPTFGATATGTTTNVRGPIQLVRFRSATGSTFRSSPADTCGATDSIVLEISGLDSAVPTDAVALNRSLVVSDAAVPTDAATFDRVLSSTDPTGPTDTVAAVQSKVTTDVAVPTDAIALVQGKALTDPSAPTDAVSLNLGLVRTDDSGTTDSVLVENGKLVTVTDSGGLVDASAFARIIAPTDPGNSSDSATLARSIVTVDASGATDAPLVATTYARTVTDSAGPTDLPSLGLALSPTDAAAVADGASVARSGGRLVDVTVSLAPQTRVLAATAVQGRVRSALSTPPSPARIAAILSPSGRLSGVLGVPRISARLEEQR